MSCLFNFSFLAYSSGGNLAFFVQGPVYCYPESCCNELEIRIRCRETIFKDVIPIHLWTPHHGLISAQLTTLPAGLLECCCEDIEVRIGCSKCGYQTYYVPLYCVDSCSDCPWLMNINCSVGGCRADGTVELSCAAQVYIGSISSVQLEWRWDGQPITPVGGALAPITASGPISSILAVNGDGLSHTLTLNVLDPRNCPPIGLTVALPKCEKECPKIEINHDPGKCNPDGTRNVTVKAIAGTSIPAFNATMTGALNASGPLPLSVSGALPPGPHTVTVQVDNCPSQSYDFTVEHCCPQVDFAVRFCDGPFSDAEKCSRTANIKATVTPQPGTTVLAELKDSATGQVIDNGNGSAPFDLQGKFDYEPSAGGGQVEVVFGAPINSNCDPKTYSFCVPDCQGKLCRWLFVATIMAASTSLSLLALVGISALAAAILAGAPPPFIALLLSNAIILNGVVSSSNFTAMLTVSSLLAVSLFLIWRLCLSILGITIGSCCGTRCLWRVMAWQVPLMVAICLIYAMPACFILTIIFALIFYLIFLWQRNLWRNSCCIGHCDEVFYLRIAAVVAIAETVLFVWIWAGVLATSVGFNLIPWMYWTWLIAMAIVALWTTNLALFAVDDCRKNCESP